MTRTRRAGLAWGGALGLGVAVAAATTESEMGVPPTALGLGALAAVVVLLVGIAAAGERLGRGRRWAIALGLTALGVVVAQDFLRPGIVFSHDLRHHAWGIYGTWRSVLDGDPWPRWNPYVGLGMPLLQFYCPLGYASAWPAQALGASPVQAIKFLVVFWSVVTAATTYGATRWAGGSRPAGLLAAAALALAPYHLMDQTFRLALGELIAFAWLAPATVAAWKLARGERGAAPWVLGVCGAGLLFTHLLSVVVVLFVLAPLVVITLIRRTGRARPRRASAASVALCCALAVGATAAFWLPIVVEQDEPAVRKLSPPRRAISPYAASLDEPLRRRAWSGYGIRYRLDEKEDAGRGMPMYFGGALLALLLLGVAAPRSTSEDAVPVRTIALTAAVTLLFACWPLARLLDGVPLIGRIMFPWRLFAPASALAALAAGLSLDRWLDDGRARVAVFAVALAALAWDVSPLLGSPDRYVDHEGRGFVLFDGRDHLVDSDVRPGELVRLESPALPPTDYRFRVAKTRVVFPEYLAIKLRDQYGRYSKLPSREVSERYGVSARYRRGSARETALDPDPWVSFRPEGGRWRGLEDADWELKPERVTIDLPAGLPAGRARFAGGWFVGWQGRADGGPWAPAVRSQHLLAIDVPAGTRRVELRYAWTSPWDRPAGLVLSLLTLGGLGVAGIRRRRAS